MGVVKSKTPIKLKQYGSKRHDNFGRFENPRIL